MPTYTLTLPPDNGDAGEQLQTDGNGVLTWESAGSERKYKIQVGELSPSKAWETILGMPTVPLWQYRRSMEDGSRIHSTGDFKKIYAGQYGEDAPEFMHHGGTIFDPVSAAGYMVAAFHYADKRFTSIEDQIDNLMTDLEAKQLQIDELETDVRTLEREKKKWLLF